MKASTKSIPLPRFVRELFWEYESARISFPKDQHLITKKVLADGSWNAIRWLRRQIGDKGLRSWIVKHEARGLSPEQLRFWQLVLHLEPNKVDQWIEIKKRSPWYARNRPGKSIVNAP